VSLTDHPDAKTNPQEPAVHGAKTFLRKLARKTGSQPLKGAIEAYFEGAPTQDILADFTRRERAQLRTSPEQQLSGEKDWREKIDYACQFIDEKHVRAILTAITTSDAAPEKLDFFARLIRRARFASDLFASNAAATWLDDPKFIKAYDAAKSISTWPIDVRWRIHTLTRAAHQASRIEGDFVECGVNNGGTAMSVITYLGAEMFKDRRFFLFDTYRGLEPSQKNAKEQANTRLLDDAYTPVLDKVRERFSPYDFTEIVAGVVPETLAQYDGGKVAYLHIDMNVAYPEVEAFKFFWPKMVPGGVVVFDDYGFPAHIEQQYALNELAQSYGLEIMMLPTGQGLIWK
jgi:hypothetical protein